MPVPGCNSRAQWQKIRSAAGIKGPDASISVSEPPVRRAIGRKAISARLVIFRLQIGQTVQSRRSEPSGARSGLSTPALLHIAKLTRRSRTPQSPAHRAALPAPRRSPRSMNHSARPAGRRKCKKALERRGPAEVWAAGRDVPGGDSGAALRIATTIRASRQSTDRFARLRRHGAGRRRSAARRLTGPVNLRTEHACMLAQTWKKARHAHRHGSHRAGAVLSTSTG
jgi:hypothetical protein